MQNFSWTSRPGLGLLAAMIAGSALVGLAIGTQSRGASSPNEFDRALKTTMREAKTNVAARTSHALLPEVPETSRTVVSDLRVENDEAAVPPQCYTKTEGHHNPCYTCHQVYDRRKRDRLNPLDDGGLQGSYDFSEVGAKNHYSNLFEDRTGWLEQISDEAILKYVQMDNYSALRGRLVSAGFEGFLPDLANYHLGAVAFDDRGLAKDESGWVAFNYKPFPGTFWPTNGSTDDVLLRLPKQFRTLSGKFDRDTYYINLSLAELSFKGLQSLRLWKVDERKWGLDLDGDGSLGETDQIGGRDHYIADASEVEVKFEQFPTGTELLHSVRYLGLDDRDHVTGSARMKELRYMKKVNTFTRELIGSRYDRERKEKALGSLPMYLSHGDQGLDNALGWVVKGFIEDYDGQLRPQSREEDMYCMGCHKAIGTTIDSNFAFPRKVTGGEGWGYVNLKGMRDAPNINEEGGEILNYLRRVGGGSEFRENPEMRQRWFDDQGQLKEDEVRAADVGTLVSPSKERALGLNKAYTHIVRHQSYRLGRDANIAPAKNVFAKIDEGAEPLTAQNRNFGWDIRLAW